MKSDFYCIWLRPVSEEEIGHLKELCYAAIADKQTLIDEKLNAEVWSVTLVFHLVLPAVSLIKIKTMETRKRHIVSRANYISALCCLIILISPVSVM